MMYPHGEALGDGNLWQPQASIELIPIPDFTFHALHTRYPTRPPTVTAVLQQADLMYVFDR